MRQIQKRILRSFRLSGFTITELRALSKRLGTSMTQIIEVAVAQFSATNRRKDIYKNNNKENNNEQNSE